jgi:hypothetical protein
LINNFTDVIFKLGGTKITSGIGDNRIAGISVAFESIVPRSGGVHGLQLSLSADAKNALRWEGTDCWPK